jgi:ribosomal protein S18 acetylase RimI-like enzyme
VRTFQIICQNEGTPLASEVATLVRHVFVEGGFTLPEIAAKNMGVSDLAQRGTRWIAVCGDPPQPIGTVFLVTPASRFRQIALDGEVEVHLLAVDPAYRGQGIADALLAECLAEVHRRSVQRVVLSTQPSMRAAQALYERRGFRRNPARDWARPDGRQFLAYELDPVKVHRQ